MARCNWPARRTSCGLYAPFLALGALAFSLLQPQPADAQFRYMGTLDMRERFTSDVNAGQQSEPGAPDTEARWDLITEIEPSLRVYYNMARHQLTARYALLFQVYARTEDAVEQRNLLGYANSLGLGYNYVIQRGTEFGVQNIFRQGTEQAGVAGYTAGTGTRSGYQTTGNKFIADALALGVGHEFSSVWALVSRVYGDVYLAYDRFDDPDFRLIPPPWNFGVAVEESLRRTFSVGVLSVSLGYGWIRQYFDQEIVQFMGAFPETLDTMMASALIGWEQRLNEQWDYSLGIGADMRMLQEYEVVGDCLVVGGVSTCTAENRGYGDPGWGPAAEAMIRFRWEHWIGATLGYSHRTQRYIENRVGVAAEADEVGLSFHCYLEKWHFTAHSAFRYMRISSQELGNESETDTMMGRGHLGAAYLIIPGVSVDLAYDFQATQDAVSYQWTDRQTGGPGTSEPGTFSYSLHQVTLGVSLAYPPPPAQDRRFMRRESEFDPVFTRSFGGAAEGQSQAGELTNPDRVENQQDGTPDADGLDEDMRRQQEEGER